MVLLLYDTPKNVKPYSGSVVTLTINPLLVNVSSKKLRSPICSFVSSRDILVLTGEAVDIKEDKSYISITDFLFVIKSRYFSNITKNLCQIVYTQLFTYLINYFFERLTSRRPVTFTNRQLFLVWYVVFIFSHSFLDE